MNKFNSSSVVTSPLYNAFHDAGPNWNLIVPASLIFTVGLCGVAMNTFVIFVTVRTPSMRGSANYLMSLICICEVLHQSGHTMFFAVTVSGKNFIGLLTANILLIPMFFGNSMNMALLLSAAADRLFAVALPHLHKQICVRHKTVYLAVHTLACVCFGLYSLYYITSFSIQNPEIPTTACISEILSGDVGNHSFVLSTMLNISCVLCYLLIWAIVRCKNGVTKETNTRLLRSLVVIMLVSIGSYFITLSIYQLLFYFRTTDVLTWQLGFIAGILLNVGAGANAPILYLNSTEYRGAFKPYLRTMAQLCHIIGGSQTNTTTSMVVQIRHSSVQHSRNLTTGANYQK